MALFAVRCSQTALFAIIAFVAEWTKRRRLAGTAVFFFTANAFMGFSTFVESLFCPLFAIYLVRCPVCCLTSFTREKSMWMLGLLKIYSRRTCSTSCVCTGYNYSLHKCCHSYCTAISYPFSPVHFCFPFATWDTGACALANALLNKLRCSIVLVYIWCTCQHQFWGVS